MKINSILSYSVERKNSFFKQKMSNISNVIDKDLFEPSFRSAQTKYGLIDVKTNDDGSSSIYFVDKKSNSPKIGFLDACKMFASGELSFNRGKDGKWHLGQTPNKTKKVSNPKKVAQEQQVKKLVPQVNRIFTLKAGEEITFDCDVNDLIPQIQTARLNYSFTPEEDDELQFFVDEITSAVEKYNNITDKLSKGTKQPTKPNPPETLKAYNKHCEDDKHIAFRTSGNGKKLYLRTGKSEERVISAENLFSYLSVVRKYDFIDSDMKVGTRQNCGGKIRANLNDYEESSAQSVSVMLKLFEHFKLNGVGSFDKEKLEKGLDEIKSQIAKQNKNGGMLFVAPKNGNVKATKVELVYPNESGLVKASFNREGKLYSICNCDEAELKRNSISFNTSI